MNILFIGNSYTYYNDMPTLFEKLAIANHKEVKVYAITAGGYKLYQYTDPADAHAIELENLIIQVCQSTEAQRFDICFLQENSLYPLTQNDIFMDGLDKLHRRLKPFTDSFFLYETWGRKNGSPTLEEYHWTCEGMSASLTEAYRKAAGHFHMQVSCVGQHFLAIYQKHPEIELYHTDLTHPSYLGSCLAALTHYQTVFGNFPEDTSVLELPEEIISVFQKTMEKQ